MYVLFWVNPYFLTPKEKPLSGVSSMENKKMRRLNRHLQEIILLRSKEYFNKIKPALSGLNKECTPYY